MFGKAKQYGRGHIMIGFSGDRVAESADATLGGRIRAVRTARGMSLRGLARELGVSPATVSQIENGRTRLSVVRLGRIADVLGVGVPEILDVRADAHARTAPVAVAVGAPTPEYAPRDWRRYPPMDFDPVLQAALAEFLEFGYHGATVRGIAGRCSLSVPGIYHHYASKQLMLLTLLEQTMADTLARARAAREEGRDPVERFSLLVEHLALFHTHRSGLGLLGAAEMRSLEGANRRRIADMRTAQQRMFDHEAEAAVAAGRFRDRHARGAARAVVTMCTALPNWYRPGGPLTPEQIAAQYVEFALELMCPSPTA
jgi:AcrR family transcriptional regulator